MAPEIAFALRPYDLPAPPSAGRVVVVDVAFAFARDFAAVTARYLSALGPRLAAWIDHHDHPAWAERQGDPRFVLVSKAQARACPELVTPELVARVGAVEHILAHGDFDGCMAAAKFLRGGVEPYPGADEDARFADAPGHGFDCSARGLTLVQAFDQAHATLHEDDYRAFAAATVRGLADGVLSAAHARRVAALAAGHRERVGALAPLVAAAVAPIAGVLLVRAPPRTSHPDKKYVLRALQRRAKIGVVHDGRWLTAATYADETTDGMDLAAVPGLRGQRGYAWGQVSLAKVLPHLAAALRGG